MASVAAAGILLLIGAMVAAGMVTGVVALTASAGILACNVLMLVLGATQLSKRFADPSMTQEQTLLASAALIYLAYMSSLVGHGVAILTIPIIFSYATSRFGFRVLLRLGGLILSMAVVEFAVRFDFGRAADTAVGAIHLIALAVALTILAMVGVQISRVRRLNRAARTISDVAMMQLNEAVVTVQATGSVGFMNESALTLFSVEDLAEHAFDIDTLFQFDDGRRLSEILHEFGAKFEKQAQTGRSPRAVTPRSIVAQNRLESELVGGLIRRADGESRFIHLSVSPIVLHTGVIDGYVLVVRDVSEAQKTLKQLEHTASHDMLTGLLNRRGFIAALQQTLGQQPVDGVDIAPSARSNSSGVAGSSGASVIAIDLDQFKIVNDACGHDAGDDVLRLVATMMRGAVPDGARLGRLGGDEFGIVLRDMSLPQVELVANRLIRDFAELRFFREQRSFKIGASIGVAEQSADCLDAQSLLSRADSACFLAKQRGRNRVQVYSLGDVEVSRHQRDLGWAARINEALEQQRFVLFAQRITPSVAALGDRDHYEVLVRLIEPDGPVIEPSSFLPAAERFQLIGAIDREVIRLAMSALSDMKAANKSLPLISINLSPSSLRDQNLLAYIGRTLREYGVSGKQLIFELTETAAVFDLAQAQVFFGGLKDLGCAIALDDVGSGFNSFYNLRQLPVDQIKIDGSYVRSACDNPLDLVFVESIQRIAEILQVQTVAEFVENDRIRTAMIEVGVNYLQGFGIHRPEPLSDVSAGLARLPTPGAANQSEPFAPMPRE